MYPGSQTAALPRKTGIEETAADYAATQTDPLPVGAEVALTVVRVVSAGLLIKSLYTLSEMHPGFQPQQILTVRISPNPSFCTQRPACIALYDRLPEGARGVSGVAEAAIANTVPLDAEQPDLPVDVEGHPKPVDHPAPGA